MCGYQFESLSAYGLPRLLLLPHISLALSRSLSLARAHITLVGKQNRQTGRPTEEFFRGVSREREDIPI